MYAKGLHPGAIWKKCDFQIHTPRDPQWMDPRARAGPAGQNGFKLARCTP
jgi:chromosome segregation protein